MQSPIKINQHSHILVMGVSGCGKSTIARSLADYYQLPMLEGDDFHSQANIHKMSNGIPLNDEDRFPWLKSINTEMHRQNGGSVISCSALKNSYRVILNKGISDLIIVFLNGNFELIYERIQSRTEHFMPESLLQNQFDTLEIPKECINVSIDQSIELIQKEIINQIKDKVKNG